jgi:hypothetical protein
MCQPRPTNSCFEGSSGQYRLIIECGTARGTRNRRCSGWRGWRAARGHRRVGDRPDRRTLVHGASGLRIHDADGRNRRRRRENRPRPGRSETGGGRRRRRVGSGRRRGRQRWSAAGPPGRCVAVQVPIEYALFQIGTHLAGIAQQRESRALVHGASIPGDQDMRDQAETIDLQHTAPVGQHQFVARITAARICKHVGQKRKPGSDVGQRGRDRLCAGEDCVLAGNLDCLCFAGHRLEASQRGAGRNHTHCQFERPCVEGLPLAVAVSHGRMVGECPRRNGDDDGDKKSTNAGECTGSPKGGDRRMPPPTSTVPSERRSATAPADRSAPVW